MLTFLVYVANIASSLCQVYAVVKRRHCFANKDRINGKVIMSVLSLWQL